MAHKLFFVLAASAAATPRDAFAVGVDESFIDRAQNPFTCFAVNGAATVDTANGIAKKVFGKVRDMVPGKSFKLLKAVPFDKQNMVGEKYVEQVWLTGEHGFTYSGTSGAKVTLNASEVAESKEASLTPNTIDFRTEMVLTLLARAQQAGDKAFEAYLGRALINCKKAFQKRLEIALHHGGTSLGTLTSATDVVTSSVFTITTPTWAPGIWLNARNCPIDAYSGATKKNSRADLNITKVDIKNKQITVLGDASDIDDIMAVGTNGSGVTLYFKGSKGQDGTGLRTVANLSTGSYLGISADTYADVWAATQVTVTGNFTWEVLNDGIEEAGGRGAEGDMIAEVPLPVWNSLNSSLDALRAFDSSYSVNKAEMGHGADSISYHTVCGVVKIVPSIYEFYGDVIVYPDPNEGEVATDLRRIGSTDVTFDIPGKGGEMFKLKEDTNTAELRAMSDQGLWTTDVRKCILFSGITS